MRWDADLPAKSREILEDCTRKMAGQNAAARQDIVENALNQMLAATETESGAARKISAGVMIAAVLEKLETPEISDSAQAKLTAMSKDFDHQLATCDWLIEQALSSTLPGDTLH